MAKEISRLSDWPILTLFALLHLSCSVCRIFTGCQAQLVP
jgi:hypothetical protein